MWMFVLFATRGNDAAPEAWESSTGGRGGGGGERMAAGERGNINGQLYWIEFEVHEC